MLKKFQQMPRIRLEEPVAVNELLEMALDHPDACYDPDRHLAKQELVKVYTEKLRSKADMLEDFFSVCFSSATKSVDANGENENGSKEEGAMEEDADLMLVALPLILPAIKPFA